MLTAKAEETPNISLWHYFCAIEPSNSVYLTRNNNNYPVLKLLRIMRRAQSSAETALCSVHCALRLKNV